MWLQRPECRAAVHPDEPEAGGGDAAPTERAGRARRPRPHTARPASVSLIHTASCSGPITERKLIVR